MAGRAPPSHSLHAAQGYTTHRKLGGRSGRRGPAPTVLGAPKPPSAASPTPSTHTYVALRTSPHPRGAWQPVWARPRRADFSASPSVYRGHHGGPVL